MKNHRPSDMEIAGLGEQTGVLIRLLHVLPLSCLLVKENGAIVYINPAGNDLFKLAGIRFRSWIIPGFNPAGREILWELKSEKGETRFTFNGYPMELDAVSYICLVISNDRSLNGGRYNERFLMPLIEQSREGIVIFDKNLRCIEWNKGMEQISGYTASDVVEMTMGEFLKKVSPFPGNPLRNRDILQGSYRSLIKRLVENISFNEIEVEFRRKDGELRVAQYRMFPAFINGRLYSGAIVRDVTEIRKAEETLRASESKFRTLVEAMGEAALTLDLDLNILFSNPAASSMYGVDPEYFIGRNLREFIDNRYGQFLDRQVSRVKKGLSDRYEIEVADFRGNPHVIKVTSSPWRGPDQEIMGSIIVFSDITQWKLTEEHLQFISTHDEITSLYNRNFYEEEKKRLGNGRRFPVTSVIIDLDDFKGINDTHGHEAGDRILRNFGQIIRRVFRAEDVVARIGGDEFAVLLPETDKQTAREAVERLREAVAAHNTGSSDQKIFYSTGTGTAKTPEELEDAIRRADTRMYREKKMKKNHGCQG